VLLGAAAGILGWGFITLVHNNLFLMISAMAIGVFAIAMLLAAVPNIVLQYVPLARSSEATGLSQVVKGIFSGIGAQVMASLLAASQIKDTVSGANYPSNQAYYWSFGLTTATAAGILLLGLMMGSRQTTSRTTVSAQTSAVLENP
jgi:hypothetical protein